MLREWLEPKVEERIWEVVEECENKNAELHKKFSQQIATMRKLLPKSLTENLREIEDCFVQQNILVTQSAYRRGFDDCLMLFNDKKRR